MRRQARPREGRPISNRSRCPRLIPRVFAATILTAGTLVAAEMTSITPALAAGTTLFNQPFKDNTVDGPVGSVKVPGAPSGLTNSACLTASGNSTANPLANCPAPNDAQGSGTLRLTPDSGTTLGGVSSAPTVLGLNGGTLGSSATTATNPDTSGVADGYLGIALDAAGTFSNKNNEGTGCQHTPRVSLRRCRARSSSEAQAMAR
jgi:hypothetical protein